MNLSKISIKVRIKNLTMIRIKIRIIMGNSIRLKVSSNMGLSKNKVLNNLRRDQNRKWNMNPNKMIKLINNIRRNKSMGKILNI